MPRWRQQGTAVGQQRRARPAAALPKRSRERAIMHGTRARALQRRGAHLRPRSPNARERNSRPLHACLVPFPGGSFTEPTYRHRAPSHPSFPIVPLAHTPATRPLARGGVRRDLRPRGIAPSPATLCFRASLARHLNVASHQLGTTKPHLVLRRCVRASAPRRAQLQDGTKIGPSAQSGRQ